MAGTYIEIGGGSGGGSSGVQPWQSSVDTAANLPVTGEQAGQLIYVRDEETIYAWDDVNSEWDLILNGLADVSGPGSATDEQVAVFDGTTGKAIKASPVVIDPAGAVTGVSDLTATGEVAGDSVAASSFVQLPALTTVQRDALTPANGMVIYNTSLGLFQGRAAGAWVNLHGWGA